MSLPQAGFKKEPGLLSAHLILQGTARQTARANPAAVTLGGEFGRRVDRIIDANILQINVDETF